MFFFRRFTVPGLLFKYLINFELIFVYGVRQGPNFVFAHGYPVSLYSFFKKLILSISTLVEDNLTVCA